jgi:hypothetical protein
MSWLQIQTPILVKINIVVYSYRPSKSPIKILFLKANRALDSADCTAMGFS